MKKGLILILLFLANSANAGLIEVKGSQAQESASRHVIRFGAGFCCDVLRDNVVGMIVDRTGFPDDSFSGRLAIELLDSNGKKILEVSITARQEPDDTNLTVGLLLNPNVLATSILSIDETGLTKVISFGVGPEITGGFIRVRGSGHFGDSAPVIVSTIGGSPGFQKFRGSGQYFLEIPFTRTDDP